MSSSVPIHPAATVILLRRGPQGLSVLMGQRGAGAAFMPGKFVFPGGKLDETDHGVILTDTLPARCAERLRQHSPDGLATPLALAAIRELWEETGQILGASAAWDGPMPDAWQSYAATGHRPSAAHMQFFFRAITPPGNTRRFDARFFVIDAQALRSDPDDFSRASDELSHLQWVPLDKATTLDLPFITTIVLSEIAALGQATPPSEGAPFFDNSTDRPHFKRLI